MLNRGTNVLRRRRGKCKQLLQFHKAFSPVANKRWRKGNGRQWWEQQQQQGWEGWRKIKKEEGKRAWNRAKKRRATGAHTSSLVKGLRTEMDPGKATSPARISRPRRCTRRNTADKIMREWLNSILRNPLVPIHFASPVASDNIRNDDDPCVFPSMGTWIAYARSPFPGCVSLPNDSICSRTEERRITEDRSTPSPFSFSRGRDPVCAWGMKRDYSVHVVPLRILGLPLRCNQEGATKNERKK